MNNVMTKSNHVNSEFHKVIDWFSHTFIELNYTCLVSWLLNFVLDASHRSFGDGSTLAASTDKNIPDSFNGVPSNLYPLVITFRTFLLMLDGTLGNSYFERYYNLKGKDLGSRLVELETLIFRCNALILSPSHCRFEICAFAQMGPMLTPANHNPFLSS